MGSLFSFFTSGVAMTVLGLLVLGFALVQLGSNYNHAGYEPGTPGHARAAEGRRAGYVTLIAALLLLIAAWFTPLGRIALL